MCSGMQVSVAAPFPGRSDVAGRDLSKLVRRNPDDAPGDWAGRGAGISNTLDYTTAARAESAGGEGANPAGWRAGACGMAPGVRPRGDAARQGGRRVAGPADAYFSNSAGHIDCSRKRP